MSRTPLEDIIEDVKARRVAPTQWVCLDFDHEGEDVHVIVGVGPAADALRLLMRYLAKKGLALSDPRNPTTSTKED